MSNGSIMELVAKGQQDEDIIDINNNSPLFNYSIEKKINILKETLCTIHKEVLIGPTQ